MIPKVDIQMEIETNWLKSIYGEDNQEEIPNNTPEPLGYPMSVNVSVDASHAGDNLTYHSQTGIIIYVNTTLIDWSSKRQKNDEISTFGSELIAARIAMGKVKALGKKLGRNIIPIDGPTYMVCDNESGVNSMYGEERTFSQEHQLIYWHSVRDTTPAGLLRGFKGPGKTIPADTFTKTFPLQIWEYILNPIYNCDRKYVRDKK